MNWSRFRKKMKLVFTPKQEDNSNLKKKLQDLTSCLERDISLKRLTPQLLGQYHRWFDIIQNSKFRLGPKEQQSFQMKIRSFLTRFRDYQFVELTDDMNSQYSSGRDSQSSGHNLRSQHNQKSANKSLYVASSYGNWETASNADRSEKCESIEMEDYSQSSTTKVDFEDERPRIHKTKRTDIVPVHSHQRNFSNSQSKSSERTTSTRSGNKPKNNSYNDIFLHKQISYHQRNEKLPDRGDYNPQWTPQAIKEQKSGVGRNVHYVGDIEAKQIEQSITKGIQQKQEIQRRQEGKVCELLDVDQARRSLEKSLGDKQRRSFQRNECEISNLTRRDITEEGKCSNLQEKEGGRSIVQEQLDRDDSNKYDKYSPESKCYNKGRNSEEDYIHMEEEREHRFQIQNKKRLQEHFESGDPWKHQNYEDCQNQRRITQEENVETFACRNRRAVGKEREYRNPQREKDQGKWVLEEERYRQGQYQILQIEEDKRKEFREHFDQRKHNDNEDFQDLRTITQQEENVETYANRTRRDTEEHKEYRNPQGEKDESRRFREQFENDSTQKCHRKEAKDKEDGRRMREQMSKEHENYEEDKTRSCYNQGGIHISPLQKDDTPPGENYYIETARAEGLYKRYKETSTKVRGRGRLTQASQHPEYVENLPRCRQSSTFNSLQPLSRAYPEGIRRNENLEIAEEAKEEPLEILDVHQYFRDDFDLKTLDSSIDGMTQIETVNNWAKNFESKVSTFSEAKFSLEYFVLDEKLMRLIEHLDKLKCKEDATATKRKIEVISYIKDLHTILDKNATDE